MGETRQGRQFTDVRDFLLAKEALEISEYQIFFDAYRDWYGHEPSGSSLNTLFGEYLRSSELPHFVKHFARRFVASHPEQVQALLAAYRRSQRAHLIALGALALMVLWALTLT